MENNNVLLRIEVSNRNLRPSEQKVAKYVLENYERVMFQTISEVASNANVSEATVLRFSKNIGYKGFQYFKLALASFVASDPINDELKRITEEDTILTIKENIKNNFSISTNDTFSILDAEYLNEAVNYILEAKETYIVGAGASGIIAQLLSYKLLRMGVVTRYISDSHFQAMNVSLINPKGLVIGISHSGSTKDTVDVLKTAYESGVKTICITDYLKSPMVKYSNVILSTYAREDPLGISQWRSSVSQVYVIETLAACLYPKIKAKADKSRKTTARAVLEKLY